jgi:hypothetical protein
MNPMVGESEDRATERSKVPAFAKQSLIAISELVMGEVLDSLGSSWKCSRAV